VVFATFTWGIFCQQSECPFVLDSSAAEFRRQPETCRAATAEKKIGAPPSQPKFMGAVAAVGLYFSTHRCASELNALLL